MSSEKPNIVLILTDQQRTDTLGYRGRTPCRTPNIDRLAREGVSFDRALCTNPLCTPSRASIFTGKYAHQVGMMMNNSTLYDSPVLTERLRTLGYHTAYAGKWHLEPNRQPKALVSQAEALGLAEVHGGTVLPQGRRIVDRWFDVAAGQENDLYSAWCEAQGLPDGWTVSDPDVRTHRKPSMSIPRTKVQDLPVDKTYDAWVTDYALQFLHERPKDQPFFLVSSYFGPHPPFLIPEPYYSMYADDIPEPPNFGPQPGHPQAMHTSFYRQLWQDHGENWDDWKKSMAVYWGYVTMMDDLVGRMVGALEAEGILDDTLVIFASDHGEMLGSHGLWQKMVSYEEALRVPFVMRYPRRIDPGIRSQANVSLIDIPATILSLLGEDVPETMLSRDLSPAFKTADEFQSDAYRFSEHDPLGAWHQAVKWRMVTDNRLKYVWNQGDRHELYDLEKDPFETINCIDEPAYADDLARLRDRLFAWMIQTSDPILRPFA